VRTRARAAAASAGPASRWALAEPAAPAACCLRVGLLVRRVPWRSGGWALQARASQHACCRHAAGGTMQAVGEALRQLPPVQDVPACRACLCMLKRDHNCFVITQSCCVRCRHNGAVLFGGARRHALHGLRAAAPDRGARKVRRACLSHPCGNVLGTAVSGQSSAPETLLRARLSSQRSCAVSLLRGAGAASVLRGA